MEMSHTAHRSSGMTGERLHNVRCSKNEDVGEAEGVDVSAPGVAVDTLASSCNGVNTRHVVSNSFFGMGTSGPWQAASPTPGRTLEAFSFID